MADKPQTNPRQQRLCAALQKSLQLIFNKTMQLNIFCLFRKKYFFVLDKLFLRAITARPLMNNSPPVLAEINYFSAVRHRTPPRHHHTKEGESPNMKKSTLVVLAKGNDCAFDGPMGACCTLAFNILA